MVWLIPMRSRVLRSVEMKSPQGLRSTQDMKICFYKFFTLIRPQEVLEESISFILKHENMLLQILHSDSTSRGFRGEYKFLSKKNYLSDAVEIADCSYRIERTEGVLYSPSYPFYYASFINCTYIFPQRKGYRTVLSSGEISLGKDANLDILESTNGHTKLLSIKSMQRMLYASSTSTLLIHFQAGNNYDKVSPA
ncbi:CUB domain protein [Dictyocaulus viviparus]|uniref:CUB domain protein n=1 Tax=Dictyocaulus viviparus TaxID=29172 RepID=A0A0D8X9X0_DICVI|nr:CUB domain protein [Dictyocaulus viviparus]